MDPLVILGYKKSVELLKRNSTKYGFQAAPENPDKPEYSYLFGRDTAICALCLLDSDDEQLKTTALTSLESLRDVRSPLGQVPFRADPAHDYRDFWFPGNLDSTLWWVLAALKLVQTHPRHKTEWQADIELSLTWLRYQDMAEVGLLIQGQRSDWADELPNHGAVLYSNALWCKVVEEYIQTYGPSQLINTHYLQQVKTSFNTAFWPYEGEVKHVTNKALERAVEWAQSDLVKQPYYIGYLSRRAYGRRCDVLGNVLAMLFGLADGKRCATIEQFLWSIQVSMPFPGKSLYPVIYPGEAEWQDGMAARNQNMPHQYHNGGIWPFIGGFWVTYLATQSQEARAYSPLLSGSRTVEQELLKLAEANSLNGWQFSEYLHGEYGTPMGVAHQSWNAAMYIMAYNAAVKGNCLLRHDEAKRTAKKPLHKLPIDGSNLLIGKLPRKFASK